MFCERVGKQSVQQLHINTSNLLHSYGLTGHNILARLQMYRTVKLVYFTVIAHDGHNQL